VLKQGATLVPALAWPTKRLYQLRHPYFPRAYQSQRGRVVVVSVIPAQEQQVFRYWSVCVGRGQCLATMRRCLQVGALGDAEGAPALPHAVHAL